jgi:hypothetical protein
VILHAKYFIWIRKTRYMWIESRALFAYDHDVKTEHGATDVSILNLPNTEVDKDGTEGHKDG